MATTYTVEPDLSLSEFLDILHRSGLGDRRPVDDEVCLEGMLRGSDLIVCARDGSRLVGVSRSVTDFHYACYLSDLAVDREYQRMGIGTELQRRTQSELGPKCKIILVAAPAADGHYQKIGYTRSPRCWILGRTETLSSGDS